LGSRYPWGDNLILEKAIELNKLSGGKMGGAVLAYYDRLVSVAVGGMLAQAAAPVVLKTDPSGQVEVLVRAAQVAQAHKKLQMDTALGLIQGFATAGAVVAGAALAVGLLMLAAAAAPAVFGAYAGASAMTTEAATALALRLAPRLMAWAARNPYLAETVVTGVVGMALDIAENRSVDPMQVVFNFLQIRQTQLQTRTPRLPTTPPTTRVTTPPEVTPTQRVTPPPEVTPTQKVTTPPGKIESDPKASALRRPPGGGDRAGMTSTARTKNPHKRSDPVVEILPRSTVPMKDFDPPEPGHYIVRKPPDAETQRQILERAGRTSDGRLRDANTGRALEEGESVWGHAPNYQFKEMRDMAEKLRWTQHQFDEFFRDPAKWQVEYGPTNSGRVFDRIPRQRPVH
jgi:HNH/ENDO VII superfamily nuclease